MNNLNHRRLHRWEKYDKINIEIVPRFKQSSFSGDEWRQSVHIEFFHKGELIRTEISRDIESTIMLLGKMWYGDEAIEENIIKIDDIKCDQPSCINDATRIFKLKRLTASDGSFLDMKDQYGEQYRQFCNVHAQRGDCSREDSDSNYEEIVSKKDNIGSCPADFAWDSWGSELAGDYRKIICRDCLKECNRRVN